MIYKKLYNDFILNFSRFFGILPLLFFSLIYGDPTLEKSLRGQLNHAQIQQEIQKNTKKFDLNQVRVNLESHIDTELRGIDDQQTQTDNILINSTAFKDSWDKKKYNGKNIEAHLNAENDKIFDELRASKIAHELLEWSNSDIGKKDKEYLVSTSARLLNNESKLQKKTMKI